MQRYGNVAGFIYRAQQQESPKPEPEPENEDLQRFKETCESDQVKLCRGCGKLLPLHYFPRSESCRDGLTWRCKACMVKNELYNQKRAKRLSEAGSE